VLELSVDCVAVLLERISFNNGHGHYPASALHVQVPSSLRNIYKEIESNLPGYNVPKHGDLEAWAKQGVLTVSHNHKPMTVKRAFSF
jgi:uracil DNA glycosylase